MVEIVKIIDISHKYFSSNKQSNPILEKSILNIVYSKVFKGGRFLLSSDDDTTVVFPKLPFPLYSCLSDPNIIVDLEFDPTFD